MGEEGAWGARKWFWLKLTTLPRVTAFVAAPSAKAWEEEPTYDSTGEPG